MARRTTCILLPALTVLLTLGTVAACAGDDDAGGEPAPGLKVVATTTQIGALTRAIAGGQVELTTLLQAGASAHDFEPNAKAVKRVNEAALVLKHGIGLDDWLDGVIEGAGGKGKVVVVTAGIALAKGLEEGSKDDDPHLWHDPERAKQMVDNIAKALAAAGPQHAAAFEANATAYKQRLDEVDAEVKQILAVIPEANRRVVTNHDAFGYFLARYNLAYAGAVIPNTSSEAQPSAKALAELLTLIKKEGVRAIFAEDEIDPKVAKQIAKDAGVRVVTGLYADSLGKKGSGADTVDGMLLANARKFAEALR